MKIKSGFDSLKKRIDYLNTQRHYIPLLIMIGILVLPLNLFFMVQMIKKMPVHSFKKHNSLVQGPVLTLNKLMDGSFQKEFESWFNDHNPLGSMFIKLNNQFYYSFFTKSLMYGSNVIIGKKGYLYEKVYIEQYLNLSQTSYSEQQFKSWANDLQALSDFFAKRGQLLIYLITPSKVAYFPEYLPVNYLNQLKNPRPDYFLKIDALKNTTVSYFDASHFLLNAKSTSYGNLLFTRGGTHWTMLSAALTAQEILSIIARKTNIPLPRLDFSYSLSTRPQYVDKDLLELCRLLFPYNRFTVPRVFFKKNKEAVPLKAAIIGGSFTHFFRDLFMDARYFSQIDHYYYLILNHYQVTQGKKIEIPINKDNPASYQDILNADVVILEENELMPYSNHFKELYFQLLGKHSTDPNTVKKKIWR